MEAADGKVELQSRTLTGPERIHVSVITQGDDLESYKPNHGLPDVRSLFQAFKRGESLSASGNCLGERVELSGGRSRFAWTSYAEVGNRAQRIGSALIHAGAKPRETRIGLMGLTTAEQMTCNLACNGFSLVLVPLYHNYHLEARIHIITSCGLETVFADSEKNVESLLDHLDQTPGLKRIVQMRGVVSLTTKKRAPNIDIIELDGMIQIGDNNLRPFQPPQPEDLYIICHTSGTTGPPKGIMLTNSALAGNVGSTRELFSKLGACPSQADTYLSYLPFAHVYEHFTSTLMLLNGVRIGYYRGDPTKLLDDMRELKPTIVAMVPRILTRIYDNVLAGVESGGGLKRFLFHKALAAKMELLKKGTITRDSIWDRLVLRKLQALTGGRLSISYSGGAPINPESRALRSVKLCSRNREGAGAELNIEVLTFFRAAFGVVLMEGYGQTECSACATITLPTDVTGGHVGGPAPWAQIKLIDVPEMNYWAANDKGEVLIRGPSLMTGYLNNEKTTAETIDKDGWLHTGDIGEWLPNGGLKIVDRRKAFFKLAQGEYVSPEVVEGAYSTSPLLEQIFVTGDSTEPHLVCVVVPAMGALLDHLRTENLLLEEELAQSHEEIVNNPKVSAAILTHLRIIGATKGLSSLEQIKAVHLVAESFSVDNGLLTPLLKLRRIQLKQRFATNIRTLYQQKNP